MPSPRPVRRLSWPFWTSAIVALVVIAGSCGLADDRPPNRAAVPASSAERAAARAQRRARAEALADQDPAPSAPVPSETADAPPPPPPSPPKPEPATEDAGTDAKPADAGAPDAAAPETADAGASTVDAAAPDPAALCSRICDRVVDCVSSIFGGDLPPGMDQERLTAKLRKECVDECNEDIDEHLSEARACLDKPDCEAFLDCIKAIDED